MKMWLRSPLTIAIVSAAFVLAALYVIYRLIDPLPPRHFAIAAGIAGSGYDNFAKQYARILARYGVALEIRNSAGAVENLDLLRNPGSGVQAALTTFGVTLPDDATSLYSLGGIFDAAIYIFYRNPEPITAFAQFRGKRLAIGLPGTALRSLILEVLKATDALDASTHLADLSYTEAIDALTADKIDVAVFPQDAIPLQRVLGAPGHTTHERGASRSHRQNSPRTKACGVVAGPPRFKSRYSQFECRSLGLPQQSTGAKRSSPCPAIFAARSDAGSSLGSGPLQWSRGIPR